MSSAIRTIRLYGHLRDHCGRSAVRIAFRDVGEAVRALEANFPGFAEKLKEGAYRLLAGAKKDGRALTEESVRERYSVEATTLHIVPVAKGAKNWMQVILGVVLIAAAFIIPGAGVAAFSSAWAATPALFGLTTVGNLALLGGAMALSGLVTPKADFSQRERADNRSSFFSNGAVNQTEEGATVPLVYGEPIIGSVVISAGIEAVDVAVTE